MSLKICFSLLTLFLSTSLLAKTYSAFLGVGGEPEGKSTMFDGEVAEMGQLSKTIGGEVTVSLNGGHSKTESIIAKNFIASNRPFIESNFEKIISDYETKILSGEITANDQLLLVINTHGAEKYDGEKTHQIAFTGAEMLDLTTGSGARTVSLDRLEKLATLAEEKGIKLAILDLSCHSGNSLPLKNSKTCVISSSGPNHFGYGGASLTFPRRLFKQMKKGANLEDAFLKARGATWDLSFPMISTDAGLEINEQLYTPMTPFLYYYGSRADKLSPHIRQQISDDCTDCQNTEKIAAIQSVMEEAKKFQSVARDARFSEKEAKRLNDAIKAYNGVQQKLKDGLKALDIPDLQKEEKFCTERLVDEYKWVNNKLQTTKKLSTECAEYSIRSIMYGDFSFSKEFYKKFADNDMMNFYGAQFRIIEQVEKRKIEIEARYPDLKKWRTYFQDQKTLIARSYKLAMEVAFASQHLYEALYNQKRSQEKESNPCKDFVL